MSNNFKICTFISLTLGILFIISMLDMPYGFYTFIRIFTLILSVIFIFMYYMETEQFSVTFIPILAIGILWNPIFPIYLDKTTWIIFDFIAAVIELAIFLYIIIKYYSKEKN